MNKLWKFSGTVVRDGITVEYGWKADTWAPSEKKARSNLIYRYKKDHDIPKPAKVELFGELKKGE